MIAEDNNKNDNWWKNAIGMTAQKSKIYTKSMLLEK